MQDGVFKFFELSLNNYHLDGNFSETIMIKVDIY